MKRNLLYSIGNIVTYVGALVVSALASTIGINGFTTGQVSDSINSLFTPSAYVFSIWSLIYVMLIIFSIYQILPKNRDSKFLEQIGPWFIVSNLLNIAWMFAWHYQQILLSMFIIIALFLSLLMITLRVGIGIKKVDNKMRFLVHFPFYLYLGWLSVAVIANIAAVLVKYGWNGFGIAPEIWTAIVLVVATAIAVSMALTRRECQIYSVVFIWAYSGIIYKNHGTPWIEITAYICIGFITIAIIASQFIKKPQTQ
jgi:translocator protein